MDAIVQMIKDFCAGLITSNDLSDEVKKIMMESGLIDENGEFTKKGKAYRDAVNSKPKPGVNSTYIIRP